MFHGYFNYSNSVADGDRERHAFVRSWWRVYASDNRWVPPHFPTLYRHIVRSHGAYLERMRPRFIRMVALQDTRRRSESGLPRAAGPLWETTVGAAVVLMDPRRQDRTAYLGLLHCVNDIDALKRFVYLAQETAAQAGYHRLVGPTGLSPHLQSGVLENHFHITPPLHTPYNPPYVPEVMRGALHPMLTRSLFHVSTESAPGDIAGTAVADLNITRLADTDMHSTLAPLLTGVFDTEGSSSRPSSASIELPPPDAAEAEFLFDWISSWPVSVWTANLNGDPAGFVMLQPDVAPSVAWSGGGRNHLRRAWLAWRSGRPVRSGRLLFGGVLPEYRGQGIGSLLWRHALHEARAAGWENLTIGPLPLSHPIVPFLRARGAEPRQTYRLYTSEL